MKTHVATCIYEEGLFDLGGGGQNFFKRGKCPFQRKHWYLSSSVGTPSLLHQSDNHWFESYLRCLKCVVCVVY